MLCDLDRELHLGRLARHLRPVVKIDDPHARRFAYRRAGAGTVAPRDDLRAADIVRAQRRALMAGARAPTTAAVPPRPEASPDDLVARMADALVRVARLDGLDLDDAFAVEAMLIALGFTPLDAGRADVVAPATARARARLRGRALLDHAADGAAFGSLLLAWTALYCLLCPPARAAGAAAGASLLTDERLFSFFTWAPIVLAVLFVAAFCWRDRGKPWVADDDSEREAGPRLSWVADGPLPAPDLADVEVRRRAADRG